MSALLGAQRPGDPEAPLSLALTKARLISLLGGDVESDGIVSAGDESVLHSLLGVMGTGDPSFAIVTP